MPWPKDYFEREPGHGYSQYFPEIPAFGFARRRAPALNGFWLAD